MLNCQPLNPLKKGLFEFKNWGIWIVVNQDLYRQTLEEMVDPRHPLVVLAGRIP
jgi:hypothetical protein